MFPFQGGGGQDQIEASFLFFSDIDLFARSLIGFVQVIHSIGKLSTSAIKKYPLRYILVHILDACNPNNCKIIQQKILNCT